MKTFTIYTWYVVLILILSVGTGCNTLKGPTQLEFENGDPGPKPENPDEIVRDFIQYDLNTNDPESLRLRNGIGPVKNWYRQQLSNSYPIEYGWGYCVEYNLKNKMGGYVGYNQSWWVIRDGEVKIWRLDPDDEIIPVTCQSIQKIVDSPFGG